MARICLGQSSVNALPLTGPGFFTGVTVPVAFVLFQEALQLKMCAEYTTGIPQT